MEIYPRMEKEIDKRRAAIIALSRRIHAEPEVAFKEYKTSRVLQDALEEEGFSVSSGIGSLKTAFRAVFRKGAGRPCLTFTTEMDALPGLGHACGHNIIGAAGAYAAIILKSVLAASLDGVIEVVGTPAEESGSGKAQLVKDGAFDHSDVVLQMHPHSLDTVICQALARRSLTIEYFGKKAHAAAAPQEGINALDAMVLFYQAGALLRQQLPPGCLFHGIIEAGGEAANVIPDYTRARFSIRANQMIKTDELVERITRCAHAAATATGCRCEVKEASLAVTTFKRNSVLEDLMAELYITRGRKDPKKTRESYGSADIANVSRVVPTIEIFVKASAQAIHTEEFARDAGDEGGHKALLDGVFFLAAAGHRLLTDPDLLERVRDAFRTGED